MLTGWGETMIKGACLGDRAIVKVYDTVREGEITMISQRGINLKLEKGTYFFKWCHVKKIESAFLEKIKQYEKALHFYADDDNYDIRSIYDYYGEFRGSNVDYDGGKLAQQTLKENDENEK